MNVLFTQILDEVRGAARFRWIAVLVAWGVCLLGWAVVFMLPDQYQSTARIFVDTRTALTPVIQGLAIQQDMNAQLNLVQQSILGSSQLERVALETKLLSSSSSPQERNKTLEKLRRNIEVKVQPAGGGGTYTIRYKDADRERSLKVVDLLLNAFVSDALGGKRESAETAQKFLKEQIHDYEQRLADAEQRLADFKKKNVGVMPGEGGDYFSRLQKEMEAVKKAQAALNIATTRREELARQLRGEVPVTTSGGPGVDAGGDTLTARIRDTESKLDQLLLRFTDKHPDVVAMRETLEQLKQRRALEVQSLLKGDPNAVASSGVNANPVYQSIQLALNQVDVEIAAIRGEINDGQNRVGDLRKLVDTVPEVEAEYSRLNRDYTVTKAQYTELVERLERAKLGDQAEASGSARFEVVDAPAASFQPVEPKRGLLIFAVLLAGLGGGGAAAYLLHFLKPVFSNTRVVHEVTGLPVLGVVSMTWLNRHRASLIRSYVFCGVLAVVLLAVGVVVFRYNHIGVQFVQGLVRTG